MFYSRKDIVCKSAESEEKLKTPEEWYQSLKLPD